jgi:hypothetical protein
MVMAVILTMAMVQRNGQPAEETTASFTHSVVDEESAL